MIPQWVGDGTSDSRQPVIDEDCKGICTRLPTLVVDDCRNDGFTSSTRSVPRPAFRTCGLLPLRPRVRNLVGQKDWADPEASDQNRLSV